ncbi:MAG: sulfate adenylyltransferase [Candidatus Dormibacteria bacterium]
MTLIAPLGGELVQRRVIDAAANELRARARCMPALTLSAASAADLELIGSGAYSPLTGFLSQADHQSVLEHAALADGTPWTLPITLPVEPALARSLGAGDELALQDRWGAVRGTITVADVFARDTTAEARAVYRTDDIAHPGVARLFGDGDVLVGGDVEVLDAPAAALALTPAEARREFAARAWTTVVAFQTRNPVHRAHEYLTKVALEQVDGLFLHPLVGVTREEDVPAEVRMLCYRALLDGYYPRHRVVLATFDSAMRYAGPREAIHHGLVRRNYGCSHFIIGRDAAGVGSHYGTYDAQHLYDELGGAARLGFTAFKFEHTFYCRTCEAVASDRTCPHQGVARLVLSGTAVRDLLRQGGEVPAEFSRPEVAAILRDAYRGVPAEVAP